MGRRPLTNAAKSFIGPSREGRLLAFRPLPHCATPTALSSLLPHPRAMENACSRAAAGSTAALLVLNGVVVHSRRAWLDDQHLAARWHNRVHDTLDCARRHQRFSCSATRIFGTRRAWVTRSWGRVSKGRFSSASFWHGRHVPRYEAWLHVHFAVHDRAWVRCYSYMQIRKKSTILSVCTRQRKRCAAWTLRVACRPGQMLSLPTL